MVNYRFHWFFGVVLEGSRSHRVFSNFNVSTKNNNLESHRVFTILPFLRKNAVWNLTVYIRSLVFVTFHKHVKSKEAHNSAHAR